MSLTMEDEVMEVEEFENAFAFRDRYASVRIDEHGNVILSNFDTVGNRWIESHNDLIVRFTNGELARADYVSVRGDDVLLHVVGGRTDVLPRNTVLSISASIADVDETGAEVHYGMGATSEYPLLGRGVRRATRND